MSAVVIEDAELRDLTHYRDELSGAARGACVQSPRGFAVYFLWRGRELLYIGSSYRLGIRMPGHADKPYDYVTWMMFETSGEARYFEGELIRAYLPDLNIDLGVNAMTAIRRGELVGRLMPLPEAARLLSVHPRTVKRWFNADSVTRAAIFKTPFPLLRWFVRREWIAAQMTANETRTHTDGE